MKLETVLKNILPGTFVTIIICGETLYQGVLSCTDEKVFHRHMQGFYNTKVYMTVGDSNNLILCDNA